MIARTLGQRPPAVPPGLIDKRRRLHGWLALLAGVSVAAVLGMPGALAAPGHRAPARAFATAGLEFPSALPPGLLRPGEKVTLYADVFRVYSGREAVGAAYVRGGTSGPFTRLALKFSVNTASVQVPTRFLAGSVFEDYVVIRDPAGGQPATLPAGGAAAPYRSWIVRHPVTVALGTHIFGRLARPQAIVARASVGSGPGQVGFDHEPDFNAGPSSFDVARDGTVWVADTWNKRLLAYAPGKQGAPVRTVKLPQQPLEVAIAPRGTIYVMAGAPLHPWDPRTVYAVGRKGKRLWAHLVTGIIFNSVMRVDRDGILWIDDPELGWIPVTSRAGRPLTIAQQIRGTVAYQPLGGGWQLPDTERYPYEDRIGLASPGGTLRGCWRLTSRTSFGVDYPQARAGSNIVEFGDVLNTSAKPHQWEYVIVRFSPAGKVLSKFSVNRLLVYGDFYSFTNLRIGQDGRLYFLQTSAQWGMRVARYSWPAAAATPQT